MTDSSFPDLSLDAWRPTRDTLQGYAQVLGAIRTALTPRAKHWWHISLRVAAAGLTTTPMPAAERVAELVLDLTEHCLTLTTNRGEHRRIAFSGQSTAAFADAVLAALAKVGIAPAIDRAAFSATPGVYDPAAVARFWRVLPMIDAVLQSLKHEHRGESGAVQLWPHHFDLALLLFTGRRVPGVDPKDEESADEQMNFGFVTGDGGIAQPYFYATAYPTPAKLTDAPLPKGAYWHTQGWTGAVLPYDVLPAQKDPAGALLEFFRAARAAGFARMK